MILLLFIFKKNKSTEAYYQLFSIKYYFLDIKYISKLILGYKLCQ